MPVFKFLPGQNERTIIHSVTGSLNTITCNSVLSRDDTPNGCVVSHSKPPTALHWAKLTLCIVPWLQHCLFTVAHHIKGKHRPWCTHDRVTPQWTSMVQEQFNHWAHCISCRDAKIKTLKNYTTISLPQYTDKFKSKTALMENLTEY